MITQIWGVKNGPCGHVKRTDTSEIFVTAPVMIAAVLAIGAAAALVIGLIP
jgi:hypothetical protein